MNEREPQPQDYVDFDTLGQRFKAVNEHEPQPEDYGITPEEYRAYIRSYMRLHVTGEPLEWLPIISYLLVFLVSSVALIITLNTFWGGILLALLISWILGTPTNKALHFGVRRYEDSRLVARPPSTKVKLYQEALVAYRARQEEAERIRCEAQWARQEARRQRVAAEEERQVAERERLRKKVEYWMNLSAKKFEQEVATLLQRRGYQEIQLTGRSGDGGIDIRARRESGSLIVQCKRYQKPAGPAIVRELYGSLVDSRADGALLFCTGGFTKAAKDFVKGKPIDLLDVWDVVKVAEAVEGNRVEFTPPAPQRDRRRRRRWMH